MAGSKRRYWPSLYDRLRNRDVTGLDDQFVDAEAVRDSVRQALENLTNTTPLDSCPGIDLSGYDNVRCSVLNYGVADLTGKIVSGIKVNELEQRLREALNLYEPRLVPDSIEVRVTVDEGDADRFADVKVDGEKGVILSIAGKVHGIDRDDLELHIRTTLDLESGSIGVAVN